MNMSWITTGSRLGSGNSIRLKGMKKAHNAASPMLSGSMTS